MRSSRISLKDVDVEFPIYNAGNLSLKNRLLDSITGGKIDQKYTGAVIVTGLQSVNLCIASGERVGLVGHNGAGKTTLLRVLSSIYYPTRGVANIQGNCVSLINIGLGIDTEATGRENIILRGVMMGLKPSRIKSQIDEIIDFTGLGRFIDLPFRTYSTGMQLRLAFAVSTCVKPEILVMDEWLSTGDEEFKERADNRMADIVKSAEIMILASHSRELLLANCTRLIWLEHGRVKMDGKPLEISKQYFGY
jgi:lipopolysaccharide transport system ATP-binding protein